jgi:hypothetical protein
MERSRLENRFSANIFTGTSPTFKMDGKSSTVEKTPCWRIFRGSPILAGKMYYRLLYVLPKTMQNWLLLLSRGRNRVQTL